MREKTGRKGTATQIYLPDEIRTALEELAARHERSISAEAIHAIERHLATPPQFIVPPLPPAIVVKKVEEPKQPKKPGRPKKSQ